MLQEYLGLDGVSSRRAWALASAMRSKTAFISIALDRTLDVLAGLTMAERGLGLLTGNENTGQEGCQLEINHCCTEILTYRFRILTNKEVMWVRTLAVFIDFH